MQACKGRRWEARLLTPWLLGLLACGGTVHSAAGPAQPPIDPVEARAAFDDYAARWQRLDPNVAELYEDDARIEATRHVKGAAKDVKVTGKLWKATLNTLLPSLRMVGDRIVFSNVRMEMQGAQVRVYAQRYSVSRCFNDARHYTDFARSKDGPLRIVAELSETSAESQCGLGAGKSLDQRLDELAGQVAHAVPLRIDDDSKLDAVRRAGRQLQYDMVLTKVALAEIDRDRLDQALRKRVQADTCKKGQALRAVLDDGGTVHYRYFDRDRAPLLELTVAAASCAG